MEMSINADLEVNLNSTLYDLLKSKEFGFESDNSFKDNDFSRQTTYKINSKTFIDYINRWISHNQDNPEIDWGLNDDQLGLLEENYISLVGRNPFSSDQDYIKLNSLDLLINKLMKNSFIDFKSKREIHLRPEKYLKITSNSQKKNQNSKALSVSCGIKCYESQDEVVFDFSPAVLTYHIKTWYESRHS